MVKYPKWIQQKYQKKKHNNSGRRIMQDPAARAKYSKLK